MLGSKLLLGCIVLILCFYCITGNVKVGPDPWDNVKDESLTDTNNVPPDLRPPLKKKSFHNNNLVNGEWFFKRFLAIVINGGQTKVNDDGFIDISLQMKFNPRQWETLNNYIKTNVALSEEMFRRSIGFVEEAIYKPTIAEKMAIAWSDYIQLYLLEYKTHLTWFLSISSAIGLLIWLWKHMSHTHVITAMFIALYLYEVFISYKEAEQKELDRFLTAVNKCSWYFWKSTCDVPSPDPLIFLKHMNPLKIFLRMFTTLISEPIIVLSESVNTIILGITDGLWFPLDKIMHGLLILVINVLLILLLIMIIFNYLLNIPFNLNLLGFINVGLKQRKRTFNLNSSTKEHNVSSDRVSGATLDRILDVCSRALDNSQNNIRNTKKPSETTSLPKLKRSSSTGRLPRSCGLGNELNIEENNTGKRNGMFMIGGGDGKIN